MTAALMIVVLIGLILIRVHVSFAILGSALLGLALQLPMSGVGGVMEIVPISSIQSQSMTAIPLFILMAHFMLVSGLMDALFDAGRAVFGRLPGGTGVATTMAGVGFAAVSGSSTAAAATLAKTTSGRMIDEGYRPSTATGMVASIGTLAGMIPPSVILVFYAVTAETSVGDVIIAGLVPGMIIAAVFLVVMYLPILRNPTSVPKGERASVSEKLRATAAATPIVLVFAAVVGTIYFGIVTPTESAAIGCLAAFALMCAMRRCTLQAIWHAFVETVKSSAMIFAIVIAAHVFGTAFAYTRVASDLVTWVSDLAVPSLVVMLMILAIYVVLGFFMDQIAIIALTVPIILPVVEALGYDAIWFGVFVVLMGEIGLITPPLGINVFVVARTAGRDTMEVFRGAFPYALAMVGIGVVFLVWPEIVLWLPSSG